MKFKFDKASNYVLKYNEEIEINSLDDLQCLEKSLREHESKDTLRGFPCCLIVDFANMEITYYDDYMD